MEGADLELVCPCGSENFERVVVQRRGRPEHVSDLVACVGCRAVYHSPVILPAAPESTKASAMGSGGGPQNIGPLFTDNRQPHAAEWTAEERTRFMAKVKAAQKSQKRR